MCARAQTRFSSEHIAMSAAPAHRGASGTVGGAGVGVGAANVANAGGALRFQRAGVAHTHLVGNVLDLQGKREGRGDGVGRWGSVGASGARAQLDRQLGVAAGGGQSLVTTGQIAGVVQRLPARPYPPCRRCPWLLACSELRSRGELGLLWWLGAAPVAGGGAAAVGCWQSAPVSAGPNPCRLAPRSVVVPAKRSQWQCRPTTQGAGGCLFWQPQLSIKTLPLVQDNHGHPRAADAGTRQCAPTFAKQGNDARNPMLRGCVGIFRVGALKLPRSFDSSHLSTSKTCF